MEFVIKNAARYGIEIEEEKASAFCAVKIAPDFPQIAYCVNEVERAEIMVIIRTYKRLFQIFLKVFFLKKATVIIAIKALKKDR